MQRAPGILWLGTLSVRAPHYEISGRHATPLPTRTSLDPTVLQHRPGLQFGLQFTPVRFSSREYVHAT
jgi:hypothetical protein